LQAAFRFLITRCPCGLLPVCGRFVL